MLSPIQSDDGLVVTGDAKKGNEAWANVEFPSAIMEKMTMEKNVQVVKHVQMIIQTELHMQLDEELVQRGYV